MSPIQMVDLHSQYLKIKPEIDLAISEVIDSSAFIRGKQVGEFENALAKYLNVKHVITCANGTDALQIALMALDLKAGDEVIIPAFTFISTAEVVALLGLKPVFADVNPATFNMDPDSVKKLITPKTRAIIPVHLFGQCADMTGLLRLAEKRNLFIIEDAAQALGANFFFPCGTPHKAGTLGKIGCTSFFPSKNLGCFGDGGAMYTNDDVLAEKMRLICNHGMKIRYYYDMVGVNSRLDTLQAGVLLVKLQNLDEYCQMRSLVAKKYSTVFANAKELELPYNEKFTTHVYNQYTIKLKNDRRDALKQYLEEKGIPTMIYYPVPVYKQKPYESFVDKGIQLKNTEILCSSVLSLPMHTELDDEQIQYICNMVMQFFQK